MLHIALLLSPLFLCIVGLFLLRTGLLVVTVRGQSMYPTLQHGDRILVVRRWLAGRPLKGQIVVFAVSVEREEQDASADLREACYVKRVAAIAGETFAAPLYCNEQSTDPLAQTSSQVGKWQIPRKHVFVCGDNKEESIDSRLWGPLPLSHVLGHMIIKLRPGAGVSSSSTRLSRKPFPPENTFRPL